MNITHSYCVLLGLVPVIHRRRICPPLRRQLLPQNLLFLSPAYHRRHARLQF